MGNIRRPSAGAAIRIRRIRPAVFPFRGKLVGTLVDPAPVEDEEAYHAAGHEEEGDGTDVIQHDPLEPEHWFIHGKEYFSRGHHDAHESIVSDEDEGADDRWGEGEEEREGREERTRE